MFLYLKIKFVPIILLVTSCTVVITDPVKEYNDEFLHNNSLKINRAKYNHKNIAKDYGILYDKEKEKKVINQDLFDKKKSTKKIKNFTLEGAENIKDYLNKNIKYVDDDLSIFYKNSKLKDNNIISLKDEKNLIFYLEENHSNYKNDKKTQKEIELSDEKLYGSSELRKEKAYNYIDNDELLVSFDYIDLISRIRTEIYLEEKEKENTKTNTVKNKLFNLFKGDKK